MTETLEARSAKSAETREWPPDECLCSGYPCEHMPPPRVQTSSPSVAYTRPVTMAMAYELRDAGLWAVADIARKYAVDRPRWWHRLPRFARLDSSSVERAS